MARKEIKTQEEYFRRRDIYNRLLISYYIFFLALMAGIVLFLYTWHFGLLRNYKIARYGTMAVIFLVLYRTFSAPNEVFLKKRSPDFYTAWLTAFYEGCPQWVKKYAERSCAKHPGARPEDELPHLTKKLKKFSYLFLFGVWVSMCLQLFSLFKHAYFIKALYNLLQPR